MQDASDYTPPLAIAAELPMWCAGGGRVLDIGAGSGRNALFLAQLGFEVDAIDASASAISRLRKLAEARGLSIQADLRDACSPELEFARYRVVLCTLVLHLLAPAQATQLLDRARDQARPGAIHAIAVITAAGDFFERSTPGERYYPEPGELAGRYRDGGWQVHREWLEHRAMTEKRADGTPMRNQVCFVIAGAR
jgi:tellurite methyltransferase